jgi:transposase
MEGCVGAHHLSRLGHDARLMPAKYVRPYSKGQKNDFRDAEAIAEAVQRPTMRFVATKTSEQLDLQALHRVRERLVSQRTGIINQIRAFLLEHGFAVRQGQRFLRAELGHWRRVGRRHYRRVYRRHYRRVYRRHYRRVYRRRYYY